MAKGSVGVETNIIIRTPKREKTASDCNKCQYKKKNVCELGRKLYIKECKWYSVLSDYNNSNKERKQIRQSNKVSKDELHKRAEYKGGFGEVTVEKADLSKFRRFK